MERSRNDLKTKIFQNNSEKDNSKEALIFNNFFEQKLKEFNNLFIEPLLDSINCGQQNKEEKQKLSETIAQVCKKGNLFFHPDGNRDIINSASESNREKLEHSWSDIFNQFKKLCNRTQDKLIKKYGCNRNEITKLFDEINKIAKISTEQNRQVTIESQRLKKKIESASIAQEEKLKMLCKKATELNNECKTIPFFSKAEAKSDNESSLTEERSEQDSCARRSLNN